MPRFSLSLCMPSSLFSHHPEFSIVYTNVVCLPLSLAVSTQACCTVSTRGLSRSRMLRIQYLYLPYIHFLCTIQRVLVRPGRTSIVRNEWCTCTVIQTYCLASTRIHTKVKESTLDASTSFAGCSGAYVCIFAKVRTSKDA